MPVIGLRWGVPGRATTTTGTSESQLRGRVEGRLVEHAVAVAVELRVEAREEELAGVQAAVGIVGRVGRRGVGVALRRQDRIGLGQAAVGGRGRKKRIFHVVGPGIDDVAEHLAGAVVDMVAGGTTTNAVMNAPPATPSPDIALAVDAAGEQVLVVEDPGELAAGGRLAGELGVGQARRGVAQELAVELVAVDVVDPRVVAGGVDLVGHVEPVVVGRQGRARGQGEDQPGAAAARRRWLDQVWVVAS